MVSDLYRAAERLMSMDDRVWLRHANPWSVWTRIATAPFLFLAAWSHVWIGWYALVPLVLVAVWTWLNPRLFAVPADRTTWSARGVFGERVFLNRRAVPIPTSHLFMGHLLTTLSAVSLLGFLIGLYVQDLWLALGAFTLAFVFKMWFVDRMAWLFDQMHDTHPDYRARVDGPPHQ